MPKESPAPRPDPEEELRRHIQALGLQSVEEYRSWCAQHGFTRKLAKGPTARGRELAVVQQQRATRHATQQARKQREFRHAADVARGICDGGLAESDVSSVHLQRFAKLVSTWFGGPARGVAERRALGRLIAHAQRERAKFFEPPQSLPPQPGAPATFLDALVVIAFHHRDWRRPLEEWESRSHSPSRQFASLLRHLFVQYDMPLFFDAVWFGSHDHAAAVRRAWYLHVGRGENIRNCALPIPYTKRMAHHFLRAPDNATIEQAIRWGQVLGLGGDEHLARTLFGTRLGERFENEEFWRP